MDLTFTSVVANGTGIGTVPVDNSTVRSSVPSVDIPSTNPSLWDAPATNAFTFDSLNPTVDNNPNAANFASLGYIDDISYDKDSKPVSGASSGQSSPSSQSSKSSNSKQKSNYQDLFNGHRVTAKEVSELERQTNLTLYPYVFGGELARIKHQFSNLNADKYYLLLNFLVYGFDNKVLSSSMQGNTRFVIDQTFIDDFLRMARTPQLQEALKKTPAYQKGCFEDIGKLGSTEANVDNMANSPLGSKRNHPSLITNLMEKIHPGALADLEKFCNAIRTRSYLSLPKGSLGSIGRIVAGINGVVAAFQAIVNDIYNGIILYIQQIYAWINGIIAQLQKKLLEFIESIIPLDLICLLLDTFQVILDDINFFTSLFNMSNSFTNVMNSIQNVVNQISSVVSNPFSTLSAFLPPNITNIVQQINQIGTDPGGFLADQLSNYGYAWAAQAIQGNIIGALSNKFGPQYAAFNPIANILAQSGTILNRYGQGAQMYPAVAASMGPNIYNGGNEDVYGHPIDSGNIFSNIAANYRAGVASARSIFGQ
jgi:hypothetical protein